MVLSAEGEGFVPPSSRDFVLPPIFGNNEFATKPIFLVFFSVILLSVFFLIASRKAAVVPSKLQFAGETFTPMFAMTSAEKSLVTNSCDLFLICSHCLPLF